MWGYLYFVCFILYVLYCIFSFTNVRYCLLDARGGYFGLLIELKADKTCKTSEYQDKWIDDLKEQGYMAGVCYGAEHAISVLEKYLSLPRTKASV